MVSKSKMVTCCFSMFLARGVRFAPTALMEADEAETKGPNVKKVVKQAALKYNRSSDVTHEGYGGVCLSTISHR